MRGLVGLATVLILVLGVTFPAVARVDQATQRAVDHAQVAVEQGEGDAVYQAIDQAQNTRTVVDQSTLQNGGYNSAGDARLLLGVVALLIAGVILVRRIRKQRSKDHTFGGLGSYFRRMRTREWREKMPWDNRRAGSERGSESEDIAEASGDCTGGASDLSIACHPSTRQR